MHYFRYEISKFLRLREKRTNKRMDRSRNFGQLKCSIESEMDKNARRRVLQRLDCPVGFIEDNLDWTNFWYWLHTRDHFSETNVNPRCFRDAGLPVVVQMIDKYNATYSSAVQPATAQQVPMCLEDIAAMDRIWSNVGPRLAELQIQLDTELRLSNKPSNVGWWHNIVAVPGPKLQTHALFMECRQQGCLPELWRAITKKLPLTGSLLGPIPESVSVVQKVSEPIHYQSTSSLASIAESRKKYEKLLASELLREREDADLEDLVTVLMVELNKNRAWFKFAQKKGVTTTAKGAEIIRQAELEKRPAQRVVRDLANVEGYLASTFLEELKSLEIPDVTIAVNKIKEHISNQLRSAETKDKEEATVHGEVYDWLVGNKLVPPEKAQQCLRLFLNNGVTELGDLEYFEAPNFEACGLDMAKSLKAAALVKKMSHNDKTY